MPNFPTAPIVLLRWINGQTLGGPPVHGPDLHNAYADEIEAMGALGAVCKGTMGGQEKLYTASTGTAHTVNLANGNVAVITMTGNVSFTFPTGLPTGVVHYFTLITIQDGTGNRVHTFPVTAKWDKVNGAPAPVVTPGTINVFDFVTYDGGATWLGLYGGPF